MFYYYKPQVKIRDGAATVDYKSLTQLALATPAADQQVPFDGEQYENDALGEDGGKYVLLITN